MQIQEYKFLLEDFLSKKKFSEIELQNARGRELRLRDNYPIFLGASYEDSRDLLKSVGNFEFKGEHLDKMTEEDFSSFNFKPGTVIINCIDYAERSSQLDKRFSLDVKKVYQKIFGLSTKIMLHTEQGERPKGFPESYNAGIRFSGHDEVALGLTILEILKLGEKEKVPICLPRNFFYTKNVNEPIFS